MRISFVSGVDEQRRKDSEVTGVLLTRSISVLPSVAMSVIDNLSLLGIQDSICSSMWSIPPTFANTFSTFNSLSRLRLFGSWSFFRLNVRLPLLNRTSWRNSLNLATSIWFCSLSSWRAFFSALRTWSRWTSKPFVGWTSPMGSVPSNVASGYPPIEWRFSFTFSPSSFLFSSIACWIFISVTKSVNVAEVSSNDRHRRVRTTTNVADRRSPWPMKSPWHCSVSLYGYWSPTFLLVFTIRWFHLN